MKTTTALVAMSAAQKDANAKMLAAMMPRVYKPVMTAEDLESCR